MVGELQAEDPRSIGPYRLLGRLGAGGMGQVFLGRSAGGRLVAVKVIRPELAGESGFRTRFAREVTAARNVSGLFTALVVDADVEGPVPWLATAYVAGPSLADAVAGQGPLPVSSVLTLAAGLAEGLQAIHAAGVVHRDLKPSNVLLADDGPRVIDFGIARAAEATMLTQTGTVIGSPGFMSPEQAEGGQVGPPSDVFSLGAVLVYAATGEGPFGTGSTPALMFRVVHREPDISNLPAQLRPVIERCLAKDPGQRPTSADLLAEFGAGQLAADWLPPPLTEVVSRYAPPGLASAAGLASGDSPLPAGTRADSPPPAGIPAGPTPPAGTPAGPPTTTGVSIPRPATQPQRGMAAGAGGIRSSSIDSAGGSAGFGGADGPPQRMNRRRLAWIAAAAVVIIAGSASAATALSSSGGSHPGTTVPSAHPKVSAPASPHRTRSSSPTASPTYSSGSGSQTQPTTTSTPTPTTTTTPTSTPTTTTTPTSTPTAPPTTTSAPAATPTP
jgi:serine/threonine protein kinase